jgi:hypothetical protein
VLDLYAVDRIIQRKKEVGLVIGQNMWAGTLVEYRLYKEVEPLVVLETGIQGKMLTVDEDMNIPLKLKMQEEIN